MNQTSEENRQRDIHTLRALGSFFCVMGALVFVGSFQAWDNKPAFIVSIASSLVLLTVGSGMLGISFKMSKTA